MCRRCNLSPVKHLTKDYMLTEDIYDQSKMEYAIK